MTHGLPDIGAMFGVDLAQAAENAQRMARKGAELQERTAGLLGRAETGDGRVRLAYSPEQGLPELVIDPRAMRMGSEELAETIGALVQQAMRDLERQKREAAQDVYGEEEAAAVTEAPDVDAMQNALQDMSEVFDAAARDATAMMDRIRNGMRK